MTGAGFPALCFAVDAVRETEYSLINVYLNICAVMATIKKFMKISGQMKNLQRSGWVYHKIENPESRSEERRVGKECRSRWSPYH